MFISCQKLESLINFKWIFKMASLRKSSLAWPKQSRVLTQRGYSIPKSVLSAADLAVIQKELVVKPEALPQYDMGSTEFPVYFESKDRIYLPRSWATRLLGEPELDIRSEGCVLREELVFTGKLREEQISIVNTFLASDANGLLCVPCGYGKTFMAIWLALQIKKRFLVVVHKEFLMSQWRKELENFVPGIRIGTVQGDQCQIDESYDCAIVMIQTLCSRAYSAKTFTDFGFSIFDECHHLGAEHFSKSLIKIQTKHMLGLSATPDRNDGLSKVFIWFLGPIAYRITHREPDKSVKVFVYRYEVDDATFSEPPLDKNGEVVRARLLNQIAAYKPRTEFLSTKLAEFAKLGRKILILSDRRSHLKDFEKALNNLGCTDIGYYVGSMKQDDLDISEKNQIILGTFAMASEAMNIPALNTILLATPKSNVEQSVGRILREKKEARKFDPLILEVLDYQHVGCIGQYRKRRDYYKACGYTVKIFAMDEQLEVEEKPVDVPVLENCAILD